MPLTVETLVYTVNGEKLDVFFAPLAQPIAPLAVKSELF